MYSFRDHRLANRAGTGVTSARNPSTQSSAHRRVIIANRSPYSFEGSSGKMDRQTLGVRDLTPLGDRGGLYHVLWACVGRSTKQDMIMTHLNPFQVRRFNRMPSRHRPHSTEVPYQARREDRRLCGRSLNCQSHVASPRGGGAARAASCCLGGSESRQSGLRTWPWPSRAPWDPSGTWVESMVSCRCQGVNPNLGDVSKREDLCWVIVPCPWIR